MNPPFYDFYSAYTTAAAALANGLTALWQLHPPVVFVVRATPVECMQTLVRATKPSTQRLHLRNLFAEGRRYYVQPQPNGFKLTSDNRMLWGGRRRARVAAVVLRRVLLAAGRPHLHSPAQPHQRALSAQRPADPAVLLVDHHLHAVVAAADRGIILALFALSLIAHRFNAALQVNALIYFVQTVIEDLPPVEVAELPASGPDVVLPNNDFREQWRKFYREQTQKESDS